MKNLLYVGLTAGLLGGVTVNGLAQTAVSSTFDLSARVDANDTDALPAVQDLFSDSQGATLNAFSGSVKALDTNSGGQVEARSSASANWANAGAGNVTIRDTGWNFTTTQPASAEMDNQQPLWTYTFISTFDGTFSMDYNVTASGTGLFGLQGASIGWSGPGGGLNLLNVSDPTASGTFMQPVMNGVQYTVSLSPNSNIFWFGGVTSDGAWQGSYDWKITPAVTPEPASMLALGAGALALLRKRRKA